MVWTLWKFSVTGKHKAVLEEPSIPLYSDNDCGLEIEGIDLLSCNAPGCNLTVCKRAHTIFPLVLIKLIIFYSQYHMACRGELSKPQGGWFCDDECKKNAGFYIRKPWKPRHKVYMSINSICSNFGNQQTSLFSNRGRGVWGKKNLNGKKEHDVWDCMGFFPCVPLGLCGFVSRQSSSFHCPCSDPHSSLF